MELSLRAIAAVVLLLVLAHFVHAYLQLQLRGLGFEAGQAYQLTYLVVPLLLLGPLTVILRDYAGFVVRLLDPRRLSARLVSTAIVLGILLRITFWAMLIIRVSFGIGTEVSTEPTIGPTFHFECPPIPAVVLGIATMSLLVPITEELVCRGVLQSALLRYGPAAAISLSAVIFALFHSPSSYGFALFAGIVLGALFWQSRTLWAGIIAHATFNSLIQVDWLCLNTVWRPAASSLPQFVPGIVAILALMIALVLCARILSRVRPRRQPRPGRLN